MKKWINIRRSERSGVLDKKLYLPKAQKFAEKLAVKAGNLLLDYAKKIRVLEWKDRLDIATNADLASEKIIIEAIEREYPDHSILSEEKGEINKKSSFRWIVDPLDGTKEYLRSIPLYNVSLSLEQNGNSLLAVIFRPTEKQLFSAIKSGGTFLNGKKVQVSTQNSLSDSFVYTYLPSFEGHELEFNAAWKKLARLAREVYRIRATSDLNVACAWLAQGGLEAFINLLNPPQPWDIKPGLFIAKEAGAQISDYFGQPLTNNFDQGIVVSNGKIHQFLLEVLNES